LLKYIFLEKKDYLFKTSKIIFLIKKYFYLYIWGFGKVFEEIKNFVIK